MALSLPTIKLAVYVGDKLVTESTFQRDVINIGKMTRSHLRLDDDNVSRMHAAIEVTRSGAVEVADLGSTNGTFVNGQKITRRELTTGDEITIGNTRLVVEITRAQAAPVRPRRVRKVLPALKVYDADTYLHQAAPEFGTNRLGLEVALVWGNTALKSHTFTKPTAITVGDAKHALLPLGPTGGGDVYPLVQPSGSGFALNLSRPLKGQVAVGGEIQSIEELAGGKKELPFTSDMRARIDIDPGFHVLLGYQEVAPPPKTAYFAHIKASEQIYLALSLIAHIGFMIMLSLIPEEQLLARRDPYQRRNALIQAIQIADQEKKKEEEKDQAEEPELEREFVVETEQEMEIDPEKPVVADKEIEVVEREQKREKDLLSKLTPEERKAFNKEKVQTVGLNKILNDTSLMADLTKPGQDLLGLDTKGMRVLASAGSQASLSTLDPFGGTLSPSSPGGDGGFQVPLGSVGGGGGPGGERGVIAGLDKSDVEGGGTKQLGKVSGMSDKQSTVKVDIMDPEVSEGYPRELVRRVIRSNMGQIKWCYQKALQLNPDLSGKVVLRFLIQPHGGVEASSVLQDTMADKSVGTCIAEKSRRWKFPPPPNGMVVKVNYPFLFKAK